MQQILTKEKFTIKYELQDYFYDFQVFNNNDEELMLEGTIKWDSCANVKYYPNDGTNLAHFCGLNDALIFSDIWKQLYRVARKMKNWDEDLADEVD